MAIQVTLYYALGGGRRVQTTVQLPAIPRQGDSVQWHPDWLDALVEHVMLSPDRVMVKLNGRPEASVLCQLSNAGWAISTPFYAGTQDAARQKKPRAD
jgi:hypothetical protein